MTHFGDPEASDYGEQQLDEWRHAEMLEERAELTSKAARHMPTVAGTLKAIRTRKVRR